MNLLVYGLVALALMGAVSAGVYKVKKWGADEVRAEWAEANATAREEELQRSMNAAAGLEADKKKQKVVFRTITEEVERVVEKPVYRDACFDPDGLRLANAALLGALTPAAKPDRGMRGIDPARGRDRGLRPAEARPGQ